MFTIFAKTNDYMNANLLRKLVDECENFALESNSDSLEDFRIWLNKKSYEREAPKKLYEDNNLEGFHLENEICKQILLINRFSRQTIRKGLADFPQLANEEFTYLYRLADYESLSKMQLIEKNGHEKQTGFEILRRLVKNGLVEEFPDNNDRRITRIRLTDLGKVIFKKSSREVTKISKVLSADLSDDEKETLLNLLKKLNEFHFNIYYNYKDKNISEISASLN